MCLCQAYKRCEIIKVKWISSRDNLIDAIIKAKLCQALKVLINTNKLDLKVNK
jgi:hypothetical protein